MIDIARNTKKRRADFSQIFTPDLGVALMNIDLHGCCDPLSANSLLELGLVDLEQVSIHPVGGETLMFEAVSLTLSGSIEVGKIAQVASVRHRFFEEAFARMQTDQYRSNEAVVFDASHLKRLPSGKLADCHRRSALRWRI